MTKKSERSPLQNQRKAETMLLIFEPCHLEMHPIFLGSLCEQFSTWTKKHFARKSQEIAKSTRNVRQDNNSQV
jgi:hypothetical protein